LGCLSCKHPVLETQES